MPKIVIIGGSFAGLNALATIFKTAGSTSIDATLVAPNSHAYFNVASPRLLSEPDKFSETTVPVSEAVQKHSRGKATFLRGLATAVDFDKREVSVQLMAGGHKTLPYDILVVASGTEAKWAGYKVNTNHEDAHKAIVAANKALKNALSVAVVGGGPTGTEVAGEIAHVFKKAKVTLYTGGLGPLAGAAAKLSGKALKKLGALGVELVNGVQVQSVSGTAGGKSTVALANGQSREHDLVLESYIVRPYSEFLPSAVKDGKGYVVTDDHLLVKGQRSVVALGDIVSGSSKSLVDLKMRQAGLFRATIQNLLRDVQNPEFLPGAKTAKEGLEYQPVTHTMMVPISRDGGVGMVFGISLPNFAVHYGKAKTFMLEKARSEFV
ncbi:FAD/NAD(P)-binding domain-containing protein [Metschnikowia bicuspidata var. bicuspidata NRRL YB-4993]|uniref:FAD/NAD(P)-binding domain-containing protein n=1 Tax=Metschnikowia bicuspidata var. bicuspidata NRRL YB-4993 TaxID=869754 RepID=A0A1A0HGU4_9ASCO|nr:FAD/NAD(P)-binding domain-containing protein [Metschnikowia bicuspidata var. bicuspidata NRRL YB-4993]OBA23102.1 FAD/NAD(P)-binding domain-containing protein [Metschnikowia bicuspidata var. bicuspidata NRRL YB-4993]